LSRIDFFADSATLLGSILVAQADLKDFLARKINEFCLRQEQPEFHSRPQREDMEAFGSFSRSRPCGLIVERQFAALRLALVEGNTRTVRPDVAAQLAT